MIMGIISSCLHQTVATPIEGVEDLDVPFCPFGSPRPNSFLGLHIENA